MHGTVGFVALFGATGAALLAGGVLFFVHVRNMSARARTWPETSAEIASTEITSSTDSDGGVSYTPDVTYRYRVSGRAYTNRRLRFGGAIGYADRAKAVEAAAAYKVGAPLVVRYDPARPEDATVEVDGSFLAPIVLMIVGGAFLAFALLFGGLFLRLS